MLSERIEFGKLRDLAEQRARGTLRFAAGRLPRVQALLMGDRPVDVTAQVALSPSDAGLAQLDLQLTGELYLVCQRCLSALRWDLQLTVSLTVLRDETEAELLLEPFDSVLLENGELDVVAVAEDEILSAVPLAAVHQSRGKECAPSVELIDTETTEPTSRPFADLDQLIGRKVNE